jgi:CDP-glycerol glycerophosphotransferase
MSAPALVSFVVTGPGELADALVGPELAEVEVLVVADRNQGLAEATGEYVWFLEPAARPAPGTLAAAAERLRSARPDVLLIDRPGTRRRVLERAAQDGVTTLERRPGLAAVAPRLEDKVLRREHVRGLRFGPGPRGELAVTFPALLTAERIAAAPGARVTGLSPAGGGPAALAGWEPVFAFLADHPGLAGAELVAPAMLQHELAVLRRLPPGGRRAHFAALAESWRRHGGTGIVARGNYPAFAALEAAKGTRRRLAGAPGRARKASRKVRQRRLEGYYRRRREAPIDPQLAVFAAYWYRGYACNPRAIYEKARELVPGMRGVWVVKPGGEVPDGVECVRPGTREYYDVLARARILVNNVNFPNHYVKREGTLHVQTHHGTPLKVMGLDLRDSPIVGARMDFEGLARRCARWDFSVSSNRFSSEIWERVYPGGYETLEVGYPRNDLLANATEADVARVRAELGIEPGRTAVLYAPTHREFRSSYVPVLDVGEVADALGEDHVLLVRAHYFYGADRQLTELHRAGRIRDVAAHPSVEELCLAADVLLTDYSSIMFDYAVLDRPIVIHAPDWEAYQALRGVYFDLLAEAPGPVTRTEAEVADALRAGDVAAPARAAFRARFCALDDGRAAERVVRRVWLGEREVGAPRRERVTS